MATKPKKQITYTTEEVKHLLCDGCRFGVTETFEASGSRAGGLWRHHANGVDFECRASVFRRAVAERANAAADKAAK